MFELPTLPYAYHALEPHIDARTMQIHHAKHHQGYINKLNKALEQANHPPATLETIVATWGREDATIRNNGGGHYNHMLFWENISPDGGGTPTGMLAQAMQRDFQHYDHFKQTFTTQATGHFGSGWAWLCTDATGNLSIITTPNQDNPLMLERVSPCYPILGLDLWEHAYYLNYQNSRADYAKAFWQIVYWPKVQARYEKRLR